MSDKNEKMICRSKTSCSPPYPPPCPPPPPEIECSPECGKIIIENGPVTINIICCKLND